MYECNELKKWNEERKQGLHKDELPLCCHCKMFMHEGDACLEDSFLTPMMYAIGKKTKPCHFVEAGESAFIFIQQEITKIETPTENTTENPTMTTHESSHKKVTDAT